MKNNTLKLYTLALLTLFISLLWSCKKINLDSTSANINTNIYTSPLLVQFRNANLNSKYNLIPGDSSGFYVTITGPGAPFVVATDGSRAFKVSHGMLTLALIGIANPSIANPITFNINASIFGFAPIAQTVTITDTLANKVIINALEKGDPIAGVSVTDSITTTLTAGSSSGDVLQTISNANMTEKATITIAPGTKMLDANGITINASSLTSSIIQYGTGSNLGLSVFPGSLEPKNVVDQNGNTIKGGINFVTAGLLSIDMNAGGTPVKKFSQPIAVSMELNNGLNNFATQQPVQIGDSIPVWSMDANTGQWKLENQYAYVADGGNGKKVANFKVAHLSNWNLDWGWSVFGGYNSTGNSLKVTLNTGSANPPQGSYEIILTDPNGNYLGANHYQDIFNGYTCTFPYTPAISQAKIMVRQSPWYSGTVVGETSLFNPATTSAVTVNLTPPVPPTYINLKMNISGRCSNKNTNINVGTWVFFWPATGSWDWNEYKYCYISSGGWSYNNPVKLKANTPYYCATWYGGDWNYNVIQVKQQDYAFPSFNNGYLQITGNGIYSPQSNTLAVTCSFRVKCN